MMERNVRFGVVNVAERTKYEKTFHIPFGYAFTTYEEEKAIRYCQKQNNPNMIVEKIFDTKYATNNKTEIYRGGRG